MDDRQRDESTRVSGRDRSLATLPTGHVIASRYEVTAVLGCAELLATYRVKDLRFQEDFVLKLLAPGLCTGSRYEALVKRCGALRALAHPSVVAVHDFGRLQDRSFYVVRRWIEGVPLRELLEREPPLPWRSLLPLTLDVLAALDACHQAGVVHGNLTPSNVWIEEDDARGAPRVTITDFALFLEGVGFEALATAEGRAEKQRGLPPERREALPSTPVGPWSDVFSAGALLLRHRPPDLGKKAVPAGLAAVLDRCLDDRPEARPTPIARLMDELKPFVPTAKERRERPRPVRPEGRAAPSPKGRRFQQVMTAALTFAVVLVTAWVILQYSGQEPSTSPPRTAARKGGEDLGTAATPVPHTGAVYPEAAAVSPSPEPRGGAPSAAAEPPTAQPTEPPAELSAEDRELSRLKRLAEEALEHDRLTRGRRSVLAYAEAVEQRRPGDPFVGDIKSRTADRLAALAEESLASGRTGRAETYIARALEIDEDNGPAQALARALEEQEAARRETEPEPEPPVTLAQAARPSTEQTPPAATPGPPPSRPPEHEARPSPRPAAPTPAPTATRTAAPTVTPATRPPSIATARPTPTPAPRPAPKATAVQEPATQRQERAPPPARAPALALDPNPARWPAVITWPADGAEMRLVQGGSFRMGGTHFANEKPVRTIFLDPFYMDAHEVTNRQYERFDPGHARARQSSCDDCPVVNVAWQQAQAYARWAGKRLPTEAEWEKAARGGLEGKTFPWGNESPEGRVRYDADSAVPVGSYAANGYGLFDMSGNVWEWTRDWYADSPERRQNARDPTGPSEGQEKVIRGGGWDPRGIIETRRRLQITTSVRRGLLPTRGSSDVGFRCVASRAEIERGRE